MDWKLMLSTFTLVFLAELGDKTQLTALAASAGSKSPWSVFIGASVALVVSTLIATLVGSALKSVLPEKVIKICAAVLFLIFGGILLYTTLTGKEGLIKKAPSETEWKPGALGRFALTMAIEFEKGSGEDYHALSCSLGNDDACKVFAELASEEESHRQRIEGMIAGYSEEIPAEKKGLPESFPVSHPGGTGKDADTGIHGVIERAMVHEKNAADFYTSLAKHTPLPALSQAFTELAEFETGHLKKLEELKERIFFLSA
ncbi:MAG: hypothetical protein A2Y33_08605 [Spirochaetes bacterium GWF1_51_8]|nr:MAG: hypothetical protein A2Y33_08605 [Spirochaetes bacterium GWF1_51_8]